MKVTKLLSLFFVFVCIWTTELYAQTTQEEYNYLTKGYKIQEESGLDMKKGYRLQYITDHGINTTSGGFHKCTFKALIRNGESQPCAILCIYTNTESGTTDYLCIPTFDAPKDIWWQAYTKFSSYSGFNSTALIWGMANLASYYANK